MRTYAIRINQGYVCARRLRHHGEGEKAHL